MKNIALAGFTFCVATLFSCCASANQLEDNCLVAISGILPPAMVAQRANTRPVSSQTVWAITRTQPRDMAMPWVQADLTFSFAGRAIVKTYFCFERSDGHRVVWQRDAPESQLNIWDVP